MQFFTLFSQKYESLTRYIVHSWVSALVSCVRMATDHRNKSGTSSGCHAHASCTFASHGPDMHNYAHIMGYNYTHM